MCLSSIDVQASAKKLKSICKEKGISVKDLQEAVGYVSYQAVYKWMSGDGLPSIDNLVRVADVLEVPIDSIIVRKHE